MQNAIMLVLAALPVALIGFGAGMIWMRACYLREMDKLRMEARRIQRQAEQATHDAYYTGYARGYMEIK